MAEGLNTPLWNKGGNFIIAASRLVLDTLCSENSMQLTGSTCQHSWISQKSCQGGGKSPSLFACSRACSSVAQCYKYTTVESAVLLVLKTIVQGLFSLWISLSPPINADRNCTHTERSTGSFFSRVKEFHSDSPCLKIEKFFKHASFRLTTAVWFFEATALLRCLVIVTNLLLHYR